ncbi:MAG TPA: M23 family metallopeptidase [Terracidiphilus sp.]|jgi:murein DD-endopeptidase MepM/ murein hydrolase activator NlpD|nr:M23 family metallopeptidase [Terracidiphilus sp.]
MTGARHFFVATMVAFALAGSGATAGAQAAVSAVRLTPALVEAGSPELIQVSAAEAASVEGEWLGRKIEFFRRGSDWIALAGVDVEATPRSSTLHITATVDGRSRDLSRNVEIRAAHYRTSSINVEPKFVEPPPEAVKEIEEESKVKAAVFAASAPEPLWDGSFRAPVKAESTDSFGTRRMFNGKLASVHRGADFRAATGTPVHAANSGVVVLARHLYFEGNCVIIDHGMGLFTESMHFSRIDVKEGQHVRTGDLLGLSGATGRVTGPHLHWAVRWQGAYLDPLKLLRLDLDNLR